MARSIAHGTRSSTLADVLERVLDKGVVIAGDIKIKLVEIELLTIQLRLVVCSVERAVDMGMDWWRHDPNLSSDAKQPLPPRRPGVPPSVPIGEDPIERRLRQLEAAVERIAVATGADPSPGSSEG
ncbi:MAG: gas vesicle protein [Myxococcales bacterium]|nr:gas vesicle protein [Myxococcales bacterium]